MKYPLKIIPNPRPLFYFKKRKPSSYKNMIENADTNVFEQVINVINTMYPTDALRILCISCGNEVFSLRLRDSRYALNIADEIIDVSNDNPNDKMPFKYYQIDLNDKEQLNGLIDIYKDYFDIIIGIETLEHVENPKLYLSAISQMLYDGGHILLTVPTITNPVGRKLFYKHGEIIQFTDKEIQTGHISVIIPHVIEKIISDVKLQIVAEYPIGLYPKFWIRPNIKSLYHSYCNFMMFRTKGSWTKLYILNKGETN